MTDFFVIKYFSHHLIHILLDVTLELYDPLLTLVVLCGPPMLPLTPDVINE